MYRISIGLAGFLLSILVLARSIDVSPDPDATAIERRRRVVCESDAVEYAAGGQRKEKLSAAEALREPWPPAPGRALGVRLRRCSPRRG